MCNPERTPAFRLNFKSLIFIALQTFERNSKNKILNITSHFYDFLQIKACILILRIIPKFLLYVLKRGPNTRGIMKCPKKQLKDNFIM